MKKIIACISLMLFVSIAIAQTQKEMDDLMKKIEEMKKDMPPEEKRIMDSMGLKMPNAKQMTLPNGMTMDKIQQKQKEMVANVAAYRKKVLVEMPRKIFTDAELDIFLKSSFDKINKKITPKAKENAQKIIAESKMKNVPLENSATYAFIKKGSQEALWLFSKLASENPKDGNLLCNYSAVVTMCGAPDLAIPVLNNLNSKYPNNSSVLNNLGQAWFALEKTDSAERFLKQAIKIAPFHVNANRTESQICGGNRDVAGQIGCLENALKGAYSDETAAELKKLGVKLTRKDINWPFPYNPDPLGFKNIEMPDYPTSTVASDKLKPEWDAFKSKCKAEAAIYMAQGDQLMDVVNKKQKELMANVLKTKKAGALELPFAELAAIYFGKDIDDGVAMLKKWGEDLADFNEEKVRLQRIASTKNEELEKEMEKTYQGKCPGEGCPYSQYCPDYSAKANKISDAYLAAVNSKYETVIRDELEMLRLSQGAVVNIAVYASLVGEQLELQKASAKGAYLSALANINYEFISSVSGECGSSKPKAIGEIKLSDFDEITCPVEDKFNLSIGIGKIAISCTKVSIEGGEGLQLSYEADLRSGDEEFGIGFGVGWKSPSGSPLNGELTAKVMGIYQFDGNGNYKGGGIKLNTGGQASAGSLSTEIEQSATYFINTDCASPGLNIGALEVSAGVKF